MSLTTAMARPSAIPPSILFVDDDPLIRGATADYLRTCGYYVLEAADVAAAIATLDDRAAKIGLIIASIEKPNMAGLALVHWVREHHPALPILLTSGSARTANLDDDLRSVGPIVSKPYRGDALVRRVRSRLRTRDRPLDIVPLRGVDPDTASTVDRQL